MKILLTCIALACAPLAAQAATPVERAASAYSRGVELFKAKKFREAIVEFNQAHRLDPSPVLLYNMARSFEQLREYASAIEWYEKYLAEPKIDDRDKVEETVRMLELLVKSEADKKRQSGTSAAAPTPTATTGGAAEPSVSDTRETSSRSTWGWTAVGVGGALVAGAVFTGLQAQEQADKLDEIDANPGRFDDQDFDDAQSSGRAWGITTDLLYGVGAASIGTGLWLLLTDDAEATTGWTPFNAGVAYTGTF